MMNFPELPPVPSDRLIPHADPLRLAVAAYLARFKGPSREHTESDLRCFLTWCAERGLDPLAARRPHLELYIRWMQEIRRFKPSTVSRRFSVAAIGFLLSVPLTLAGVAWATPPSGVTSTTLGRISLGPYHEASAGFKLVSKDPTDTVVLTTTIDPGGSTGWHSHPGPAFIVVTQGTLTVYDGDDPTCTPHQYGPGTGFLDPGLGHVHIARNEGTTPVTVVQTYLNVPPGGSPRIDAPAPGNCPF